PAGPGSSRSSRGSRATRRSHGNYPHHAERLVEMLGLADQDRAAVARAIRARRAADLEAAAAASGAIVVRVRTEDEWQTGEPGRAAAGGPLVATVERPDAGEVVLPGGSQPLAGAVLLAQLLGAVDAVLE